ncbi:MAG TPA: hypothetical protein VGD03_01695 [Frankiaceae bacterium]|nr:hypothetical protein [Mycobacterium sp.]
MTALSYAVEVSRDDRWWSVRVPAIDGLTQARRLADVDQAARELIADALDVPISQVAVRPSLGMVTRRR